MAKTKNLVKIHLAVLLFGLAGLFGKLINLSSTMIVLGRVFFSTMAIAVAIYFFKIPFRLRQKKDYLHLSLQGLLLALHWISFFEAIKLSTVAIGLLTFLTFPVFTAMLEPYFSGQKFKGKNLVLPIICLIGVGLVIPKFDLKLNLVQGAIYGIVSGFTFAILSILNKKQVANYPGLIVAFYQDLTATIILCPFLFFMDISFNSNNIFSLAILGILFTAVSHVLFINGLKTVKAKSAAIIGSLEPFYGIIAAVFILREVPNLNQIAGGLIILFATTFETISSKYSTKK